MMIDGIVGLLMLIALHLAAAWDSQVADSEGSTRYQRWEGHEKVSL